MVRNWTIFQLLPPISLDKTVFLGKTAICSSNWRSSKCCFTDRNWSPLNPKPQKRALCPTHSTHCFHHQDSSLYNNRWFQDLHRSKSYPQGLGGYVFFTSKGIFVEWISAKTKSPPKKNKTLPVFSLSRMIFTCCFLVGPFFFGGGAMVGIWIWKQHRSKVIAPETGEFHSFAGCLTIFSPVKIREDPILLGVKHGESGEKMWMQMSMAPSWWLNHPNWKICSS